MAVLGIQLLESPIIKIMHALIIVPVVARKGMVALPGREIVMGQQLAEPNPGVGGPIGRL